MRLGRGGGEERGADEGGHCTAVFLRSGDQLIGETLFLRPCNVCRGDRRNADAGNVLFLDIHAEGKVGGEDELAPRVKSFHIRGGIGLGVAELLCLLQGGGIVRAGIRHGREHIVRRAVEDALDRSDFIKLRCAGEGSEPGNAAACGGGAAQRHAHFFGKGSERIKAGAHELFVRRDDVLARAHGCVEVAVCRFDAAHDLHHNINRGIAHDLIVIGGHGACELRTGAAGENGSDLQIASPLAQLIEMGANSAEAQKCNFHGEIPSFFLGDTPSSADEFVTCAENVSERKTLDF